jgi:hypothetical protein
LATATFAIEGVVFIAFEIVIVRALGFVVVLVVACRAPERGLGGAVASLPLLGRRLEHWNAVLFPTTNNNNRVDVVIIITAEESRSWSLVGSDPLAHAEPDLLISQRASQ